MQQNTGGQPDSVCKRTMTGEKIYFFYDPKHTVKATQKGFKDNKVNVLEWSIKPCAA